MKSIKITNILIFLQNLSINYPLSLEYKLGILFATILILFILTAMKRISYLKTQNTLVHTNMKVLEDRVRRGEENLLFIITNIQKVQEIRRRKIELEEKYRDCKREANIVKKRQEVAHEYYVAKKEFANTLTVKSLL
jgi:hypothetical protein